MSTESDTDTRDVHSQFGVYVNSDIGEPLDRRPFGVNTETRCGSEIRHHLGNFPTEETGMGTMTSERTESLSTLVRRRRDEGWSFREMERRAEQRGHRISHSQLADYAAGTVRRMPTTEGLEALAAALDVGVEDVRAASMLEFWGYVPRELKMRGRASRVSAAMPPDLTPDEEEQIVRMVKAWLASQRNDS